MTIVSRNGGDIVVRSKYEKYHQLILEVVFLVVKEKLTSRNMNHNGGTFDVKLFRYPKEI